MIFHTTGMISAMFNVGSGLVWRVLSRQRELQTSLSREESSIYRYFVPHLLDWITSKISLQVRVTWWCWEWPCVTAVSGSCCLPVSLSGVMLLWEGKGQMGEITALMGNTLRGEFFFVRWREKVRHQGLQTATVRQTEIQAWLAE